ncbi:MAG TPA: HesA/MoeB/ThiF family protein [Methanomicrobiales archaeon]|nr:HesA/MoeB/ThiF family protein [Methanomicrobiales archaeon]
MLGNRDRQRYERQIQVFDAAGQERLKEAEVFIGGAGGLGSVVALYLAAAGVGRLRIADCDAVSLSNLNRQILYRTSDLGKSKALSAGESLTALNPEIEVITLPVSIDEENAVSLVGTAGLIVDALDNYPARYLLNRIAQERRIPFIHGAVHGFDGQVTTIIPGRTACLRCFLPRAPPHTVVPVIGATCGVIGSIQATEAVKYITGLSSFLENRLLLWDGRQSRMDEIGLDRNPNCPDCGEMRRVIGDM